MLPRILSRLVRAGVTPDVPATEVKYVTLVNALALSISVSGVGWTIVGAGRA